MSASPFLQYVPGIMGFLRTCMAEEDRTDQFATATLGLIGDFGETYKKQVQEVLMEEWVQSAIGYGRQRGASKAARRNATYAQKVRQSFVIEGRS
jgi:importin subunit beta-1